MNPLSFIVAATAATAMLARAATAADPVQELLGKFSAAWGSAQTYECTIASHEVKGSRVQDRVYFMRFAKPLDTRIDVIGGDQRGSAAVWHGGNRIRGHQGGILAAIRLNVDIHSRIATSLRGSTIAQANFGSLLTHLRSLDPRNVRVMIDGAKDILWAKVAPAPPDDDVTSEAYFFGRDGFPTEYFQYGADKKVLKHVVYSGRKVNIDLPASTFSL